MLISHALPSLLKQPVSRLLLPHLFKMAQPISTSNVCETKNQPEIKPVTHVIFDMDGLLLDTEPIYMEIRRRIIEGEFGKTYDTSINSTLQGLLSLEIAQIMVNKHELPINPEEFCARAKEIGAELFKKSVLMPDTEGIYKQMITQITEKYGKKYTQDIRLAVLGTNEQTTSAIVVERCGLPITVDEFLEQFHDLQTKELGKCTLLPGAERLIRHLHAKKVPIAVATSSGKDSVKVKTANFLELFSLFHHVVMGSSDPEVKNGKPAPDIFQVCASRFDDKPACEKCLVFEDAPNGVTGARAANMQTVMVPDPELPKERTAHSTVVLKSLLDFKPETFGLPAF